MKFVFSFFVLMILSKGVIAGKIIIHYERDMKDKAEVLKTRLTSYYNIPERLIEKSQGKCISMDNRFLEFCINTKGDLELIPNNNKAKILTSFQIFKLKRS